MIRVVIDTNVLVSAMLNPRGSEAAVIALVAKGALIWCVSAQILAEYEAVLARPKFRAVDGSKIKAALDLARFGEIAMVVSPLSHSSHDPDNRFYECASVAQADYIVTGNRRHFQAQIPPTKIVNAPQLLRVLD